MLAKRLEADWARHPGFSELHRCLQVGGPGSFALALGLLEDHQR